MKLLLLVGRNKRFLSVATEAARIAFPAARVQQVAAVREALAVPESLDAELLAIADVAVGEITRAAEAVDSAGLPRWGVVVGGGDVAGPALETIAEEDWEPQRMARIFGSALARHRLARENARLRGDLRSIGTRIAHDLRSPLGGIFAAFDSLNEALADEAPACAPLSAPILDSAEDLMKLIQQLTLLTKATADGGEQQQYNMGTPVLTALERHGRLAAEKQASFVQPTHWPELTGDLAWTEAIWWNLIDNALRHAGERPQIELAWQQAGGEIVFRVCDGGAGVPPEKLATLFQSFQLLHQPAAARGLGLPIVQRLVELQGGRCGYEPRLPAGACFYFTLPAAGTGDPPKPTLVQSGGEP